MEGAKSWAVLALLGGAAPLLSLYLLFVRRVTGNSRTTFRCRKPGLGEVSGEPPADEVSACSGSNDGVPIWLLLSLLEGVGVWQTRRVIAF